MNELQQERLINYFSPIYYVEYEETLPGELFPHIQRFGFYQRGAKKEALEIFERNAVLALLVSSAARNFASSCSFSSTRLVTSFST